MARGLLHQRPAGDFGYCHFFPPRAGKFESGQRTPGLAGRHSRYARFGCARLWFDRIVLARFRGSGRVFCVGQRDRSARRFRRRGSAYPESHAAARAFPVAHIYRSEPAYVLSLRRAWWHALFSAAEFDSGATLQSHGGGRGVVAVDPDYLSPFAMVGRTGAA